jgi:glucose/arabinose dehydrogenase
MNIRHSLAPLLFSIWFTVATTGATTGAETDAAANTEQAYKPATIPAGYRVVTIPAPLVDGKPVQFGVGGIDFAAGGVAVIAGRTSGIWRYKAGKWSRFAEGLHDPQGIRVMSPDGSAVVVAQKPELTLVQDTDGDGRADLYKTICDRWRGGGNYCEYVHGPVIDSAGDYYVSINLSDAAQDKACDKGGGAAMGTSLGYDGWAAKITREGEFIPFACGLRSAAGIGISNQDEVFITDNQGGWIGTSTLNHLTEGSFYGYPASLLDLPEYRQGKKLDKAEFEKLRKPPAAWIPHGELANSPGNPEFDETGGKFGPFAGQIFIGDQTRSNIFRAALEKVNGQYQGAVFNFIDHLQSGCIRIRFDQTGRLWVGQTGRGWGSIGGKTEGLQRIEWDHKTIPFEMHSMKLTPSGFAVRFTRPVDPRTLHATGAVKFKHWHYHYHGTYGSPKVDVTDDAATVRSISGDGRTLYVDLPLKEGQVYQIITQGVRAADGASLSTTTGYYTLNSLLK